MGTFVGDYSRMPAGEYTDTVTFTAKMDSIYTTITWSGPEINGINTTTFTKDGVTITCGNIDKVDRRAGLSGGGTFSTSIGKITKIEIYCNPWSFYQPGIIDGTNWILTNKYIFNEVDYVTHYWIEWQGTPATTVPFNNGFLMESNNYNDYIKVTYCERL